MVKISSVLGLSFAALAPMVSGRSIKCPSSSALAYAECQIEVNFEEKCDVVAKEIDSRINGQSDKWYDPHNNGTYTATSIWTNGQIEISRVTGDNKYTDKMIFGLTDWYDGTCAMTACSRSQTFSILDFGTNFCNLHNLYCSDPECRPFNKLDYTEKVFKCTDNNVAKCYKV